MDEREKREQEERDRERIERERGGKRARKGEKREHEQTQILMYNQLKPDRRRGK